MSVIADIAAVERQLILDALQACGQSRRLAAKRLGLTEPALYRRMHNFGLFPKPDNDSQQATSLTPDDIRKLVAEAVANAQQAKPDTLPPTASGSIRDLCERYFTFAEGYYPKVEFRIVRAIDTLVMLHADEPIEAFGPKKLKAIRESLIEEGLSRKYINSLVDQIKRIFRWGASEELVPGSVAMALRAVEGLRAHRTAARETDPVKPVPIERVESTLRYCTPTLVAMVRFQLFTGCRPQDVCNLRPMDIDRSGEVWLYRPAWHKNKHRGKPRVIAVGPRAQELLTPYLLRDPGAYCFTPRESMLERFDMRRAKRKTPVQPSQRDRSKANPEHKPSHEKWDEKAYCRSLKRRAKQAGVGKWTPNQLRHLVGTMVRTQFGLESAQLVLGHARCDTTQVYAEKSLERQIDLAKQIG